jgi:hypothetical protein
MGIHRLPPLLGGWCETAASHRLGGGTLQMRPAQKMVEHLRENLEMRLIYR